MHTFIVTYPMIFWPLYFIIAAIIFGALFAWLGGGPDLLLPALFASMVWPFTVPSLFLVWISEMSYKVTKKKLAKKKEK